MSRPRVGEVIAILLRCSGEWRDFVVTGVVDGRAGSWQVRTRPLGRGDEVRPICIADLARQPDRRRAPPRRLGGRFVAAAQHGRS